MEPDWRTGMEGTKKGCGERVGSPRAGYSRSRRSYAAGAAGRAQGLSRLYGAEATRGGAFGGRGLSQASWRRSGPRL